MNRTIQKANCLLPVRLSCISACSPLFATLTTARVKRLQRLFSVHAKMGAVTGLIFSLLLTLPLAPLLALLLATPVTAGNKANASQPFFDTHLHYNAADAERFSVSDIVSRLQQNGVAYAAVTSTPISHSLALYKHAPQQIIPILGAYRSRADKISWVNDAQLPERLASQLEQGHWRGIGELHIFARDRHSPVFKRIIQLAREYQLPLLIHCDPVVIDNLYQIAPELSVIWAHGGTFAYADLLADYLQRYPTLMIDLSVRDSRIAPQGKLDDAWYQLFISYPERFLLGVDTYATARWQNYGDALAKIRHWLNQLPDEVAQQMAYKNAIRVYQLEKTEQN